MGVDSAEWIAKRLFFFVNYLHTIALYSNGLRFLCSRIPERHWPERNASKARAREVAFFYLSTVECFIIKGASSFKFFQ